jgi:hypothetical protein
MPSLADVLGRDAPPGGARLCNAKKGVIDEFLKRLENVYVVDHASEARLRRVCEAVDTDVNQSGDNLVFNLTAIWDCDTGTLHLKRVLSLGVRPDVPNAKWKLPLDIAVSQKKFGTAEAFALCRAVPVSPDGANFVQVRSIIVERRSRIMVYALVSRGSCAQC